MDELSELHRKAGEAGLDLRQIEHGYRVGVWHDIEQRWWWHDDLVSAEEVRAFIRGYVRGFADGRY